MAQFTRENIEKLLLFLDCHGYLFPEFSLGKPTLLGSGGFSMVYAMERRQDTSQHYALKVTGFQRYATSGAEFRESVRLQRTLLEQCPYVVRILDSRELLLTMEPDGGLLSVRDAGEEEPGEELRLQLVLMDRLDDVIGKSKFGQASLCRSELAHPEEIRRMGVQIGTALMYAHKNNILHRDVKLENIFWDSEDACYKLGDFGAAKYTQDGNAETIIYTEGYGAPEVQHQVLESYNDTADIYSLGMTLYLLLNDLRFPGSEGYHVSPVHYDPQFVFPAPEKGTAAFLRVIRKMCSFYPEDRYQSMAQAVAALAEAHNAEEGTAQTIWVDLPTETYRIDPESISQHRQETRADRILTQKQLKRSAAIQNILLFPCFVLLFHLSGANLRDAPQWVAWGLPISLGIEALFLCIGDMQIILGLCAAGFTVFAAWQAGGTLAHVLALIYLMLGLPAPLAALAVSLGVSNILCLFPEPVALWLVVPGLYAISNDTFWFQAAVKGYPKGSLGNWVFPILPWAILGIGVVYAIGHSIGLSPVFPVLQALKPFLSGGICFACFYVQYKSWGLLDGEEGENDS